MSQGVTPMSEPVTVTYLDLDRLIDTCGLTDEEKRTVEMLMEGYTRGDIAELCDMATSEVRAVFKAAVDKIVERNEYEWHRSVTKRRSF